MASRAADLDGGRDLTRVGGRGERLALIANPVAGGGRSRRAAGAAQAALREAGYETSLAWVERAGGTGDAVRRAADAGARVVALLGGDGTVHEALPSILETDVALLLLPFGRGNDFARALGLPRDGLVAARAAGGWTERAIDVGRANGVPFATIAALGFDAEVAAAVMRKGRALRGSIGYVLAALRVLSSYRARRLRLTGPFGEIAGAFFLVAIGNATSYGGGMRITPDALLDDGSFDLCIVEDLPRLSVLTLLPKTFSGGHVGHPAVRFLRTASVDVASDEPLDVYADGEPATRTPARLDVLPRALRVLAPKAARRGGAAAARPEHGGI